MGDSPTDSVRASIGWDVFLLALLLFALLNITGMAEAAALPHRVQDVLRHPVLGDLLSQSGMAAMGEVGPRPGDPIGLLLNAVALGLFLVYVVVDLALRGRLRNRVKWLLLAGIVIVALLLPTAKLMLLRQASGPASYAHDGGVIQTETTIQYLFDGKNPYVEDYLDTPMAEWGFSEYRTALYHFPYLPWTFLFSAPFSIVAGWFGGFDQRLVYMVLLIAALFFAPSLVHDSRAKLALVAALALNPLMGLDVIFGQNDVFVLSWLVLSLVAWATWRRRELEGADRRVWLWTSAILFGLACASKPTAWFFAPFYGLLVLQGDVRLQQGGWVELARAIPRAVARAWPAAAVFAVVVLPYFFWDPFAFYDDVWRWSSGQGETGYQIWGWGASNFVLAFGLVADRFAYWPFWVTEILVAGPVLLWLMRRQQQRNTLANAAWHYGVFLMTFFYVSRFLNENYLGYILAFFALGLITQLDRNAKSMDNPSRHEPTQEV